MLKTIASALTQRFLRVLAPAAKRSPTAHFHGSASTTQPARQTSHLAPEKITRIAFAPWDPYSSLTFTPPAALPPATKEEEEEEEGFTSKTQTPSPPEPISNAEDNFLEASMTTFTPWDPCASRPIHRSSIPLSPRDMLLLVTGWSTPKHIKNANPPAADVLVKKARENAVVVAVVRPWPYKLPKAFWPRYGTTLHAMYGQGEGSRGEKAGFWQRVFYGVAEEEEEVKKGLVGGK